jgi:hypothetical protein
VTTARMRKLLDALEDVLIAAWAIACLVLLMIV